jgi:hypothetical protein
MKDETPFAFMSGYYDPRHDIAENLRNASVLAKPYRLAQIKSMLSGLAA